MAEAIVSYPGAKWRFYKHMVDYFPLDMKVFIEPFFGGGSVSLSVADDPRFTKLERMIGGDLYPEMWAFWTGIKQNPSAVIEILTKWFNDACPHHDELYNTGFKADKARLYLPGGANEYFMQSEEFTEEQKADIQSKLKLYNVVIDEGQKLWNWAQDSSILDNMTLEQRAARMLLVNKISFSGMGDSGSLSKDQLCDFKPEKIIDRVYETSKLLQKVEMYNVSFEETMKYGNDDPENSFIFLDPPYYAQEKSGLYGKNGSTHKGFPHEHFAEFTKQMKCKWFITYDDSVAVRKMFQGKTALGGPCYIVAFTIDGGYTMAGKTAEDALAGEEAFISNYDIKNVNKADITEF